MTSPRVARWLADNAPDLRVIDIGQSTATVAEAAATLTVEPGQIAKSLAVRAGDLTFLLVTSGTARLDNRKCKDELGARPRMLGPEETLELTGHPVGGVCPFALETGLPVYFDRSLQAYTQVYPAGGSLTSSVEVPVERLFALTGDRWVDLCRLPEEPAGIEG